MKNNSKNWYTHPNKKVLAFFTLIFIIGAGLSLMSVTDLFTERIDFFNPLMGINYGAFMAVLKLYVNYFKAKNEENVEATDSI